MRGFPSVWKLFLLYRSLPEAQMLSWSPVLIPFFFFFSDLFCPTLLHGDYLRGLLPVFSRCSVGAVPHTDVFFIYLWRGRWSPRLTPLPSWKPPLPSRYFHGIVINCVVKNIHWVHILALKVKVKVTQSCLILCNPMEYTVHGILQARILEWVAFPFSRGSSQPRDRTQVSHIAGGFFTIWATREAQEHWSG